MKAFIGGCVVIVAVVVVTWAVLGTLDMSAQDVFTSGSSVRL